MRAHFFKGKSMKRRHGLKAEVLALIAAEPRLSSVEIADRLDTGAEYVRTTLRRSGIRLANARGPRKRKDVSP